VSECRFPSESPLSAETASTNVEGFPIIAACPASVKGKYGLSKKRLRSSKQKMRGRSFRKNITICKKTPPGGAAGAALPSGYEKRQKKAELRGAALRGSEGGG